MKRICCLLLPCLLLSVALCLPVQAKAHYKGAVEMIETAQAIAVVEITRLEKVSVKGKHWTYGQKASAQVESVVKGQLPNMVSLYGDEDFICARCHFEVGRYLVFLDRDGELLTGNNWHLSARKITDNQVEWFAGNDKIFENKSETLPDVLKDIRAILLKAKQAESKSNT